MRTTTAHAAATTAAAISEKSFLFMIFPPVISFYIAFLIAIKFNLPGFSLAFGIVIPVGNYLIMLKKPINF